MMSYKTPKNARNILATFLHKSGFSDPQLMKPA